ncbi:tryptophan 2,3-dioxygenase family protein [Micromonospora sp. R77]|uniref:tryptophan 2,3-dioxygenase family protein n=1 Tax=Micromonospora sp. R77 TaxID=2925836 RepID=UPI001F6192EC|nr:tryptophan 2,3-dioxygenase family protein [Micromonospora sp. R77]MCI4061484.1 tryptophan 2,3-dioxygenase family protein [Micromonospora sp. R77]
MTALKYADYLRLETLFSLQEMRTPATDDRAVALAEQFFIITHQSCELWLKQVVADLDAVVQTLTPPCGPDDLELGVEFLLRTGEILRVLHHQLLALEKLPIRHFVEFRPRLDTASGVQSAQFRQLTGLLGDDRNPGSLYEAFTAAVGYHNLSVAEVCRLGVSARTLHRIVEALLEIGNGYWHWKVAHLALISKMVGNIEGTGGSSGIEFLLRRIIRPFPELRRLRGQLH